MCLRDVLTELNLFEGVCDFRWGALKKLILLASLKNEKTKAENWLYKCGVDIELWTGVIARFLKELL